MKTKIFLALFFAINLLSCSKDSGDDENTTFTFQVEVQNVTDRAATITWTRPEGSNISYQIFLNNEMIEDNFGQTAYTFTNLLSETSYTGKIIATNGSQTFIVDISFVTEIFSTQTFVGNISLLSQAEVNDFGNHHFNIIDGNLVISKNTSVSSVVDLSPLNDLIQVTGSLEIRNTSLEDFEGLNNLKNIGDYFEIKDNDYLVYVTGLESLESINYYIYFHRNDLLKNVDGLSSLNTVRGVNFFFNLSLESVDFLNEPTSTDFVFFDDNPALQTISGFRNIKTINEDLIINNNDALLNFSGLNSVETVNGVLDIYDNKSLEYLSLQNLRIVGRFLDIVRNDNILNLDGINNVELVNGNLWIGNNTLLSDLCGISPLLINGGAQSSISIERNLYNPTLQDFINGDCRL